MLRYVYSKVQEAGYSLGNADITVMCERPKLAPHNKAMRANIASDLQTDISNISVKATTTENWDLRVVKKASWPMPWY